VIGLDTNVLVRFIMRDEPVQTAAAAALLASLTAARPGYISSTALVELWWVLGRSYGRSRSERCELFGELLDTDELVIGDPACAEAALAAARAGADFADGLIVALGSRAGCDRTMTFDRVAARRAGMKLI
jgi:predicted nucleic-acid-binding protein